MGDKIKITRKLVESLDGRCFQDLDMSERIEGLRFTKTQGGIDMLCIGCDQSWGYSDNYFDPYGEYYIEDTYSGGSIDMILNNNPLIKEISQEKFSEMEKLVNRKMRSYKRQKKEFEKSQEQFNKIPDK